MKRRTPVTGLTGPSRKWEISLFIFLRDYLKFFLFLSFFVYDNECNYIIIHYMIVCTVDVIVRISG